MLIKSNTLKWTFHSELFWELKFSFPFLSKFDVQVRQWKIHFQLYMKLSWHPSDPNIEQELWEGLRLFDVCRLWGEDLHNFFHFLKRSFNRPVPGCFSGWFLFSWRSMSAIEICLPKWCETCSKEWRDLTVIKTVTGPSTSNSVRVVRDSSLSFSSSNQVKVVIKTKEVNL